MAFFQMAKVQHKRKLISRAITMFWASSACRIVDDHMFARVAIVIRDRDEIKIAMRVVV